MSDQPAHPARMRVEQFFTRTPHPEAVQRTRPRHVKDPLKQSFNGRLALWITNNVGTMWCAYIFAVIGITGIVASLTNNTTLVLIVAAVSGYFLQLVLLPIIIVGQNLQAEAADHRSEQTYKDAEVILHECQQLQEHLQAQDTVLDDIIKHLHGMTGAQPA
ncbi:MAG: DUF1003 domain-containing protein [Candidatus Dormibacteraeota bacterium]|nr:DUF1003 domain-containing protein [Candidatus Dormibacteraeota bacterium]